MKLVLIRHGDPDYVNDTLTAKGRVEASLLAERTARMQIDDFYVSPLGRARDTAAYTLQKTGGSAVMFPWLEEFPSQVDINGSEELIRAFPNTEKESGRYRKRIVWDMVPAYWTEHPEYFHPTDWKMSQVAKHSDLVELYTRVTGEFDQWLANYGYVREGNHYRVERESRRTAAFFCHFGVSCVLMAHLFGVSPFVLWHSLMMAPSSVTELVTEEREKGCAFFRATRIGDISHLYAGGEEPSFAGRFCEVFSDQQQRH